MPYGNRTLREITLALGATVQAANADIGVVLTDQRLVGNNREALSLIESQNNGVAKGWLIAPNGFRQDGYETSGGVGLGVGGVEVTLQFGCDFVYPYNDKLDANNFKSVDRFWNAIMTVLYFLNNNRSLGFRDPNGNADVLVRHRMLRTAQPFAVVPFGTGADAVSEHVGLLTIDVQMCYNVATPQF